MSSGDRISFTRILVITADDFGYCSERNRGISECFKNGVITRTSLLVNGSAARQACDYSEALKMPMGLHLNLTEGSPINKSAKSSSLLSESGYFLNRFQLLDALQNEEINDKDICLEIESQIKEFQALNGGKLPCYVDGHQHVHVFPYVREIFCKVLNDHNIEETRLPLEILSNCNWASDIENFSFLATIVDHSFEAKKLFLDHSLKFSDRFVGLTTMSHNMSEERIEKLLIEAYKSTEGTSNVACEIMTHPGYPCTTPESCGCGTGADEFSRSGERRHELNVLMSPTLQKCLKDIGVHMAPTCIFH